MSVGSFLRLLCLAAIWGASFLFVKIAANTFGPAYLIELRVGFAALSLLVASILIKKHLHFRDNAKHFFIIGLFNTALPFLLFAYAAQTLNASTLSILNSTAAIWGAIIGVIWHNARLDKKALLGLALGIAGVVVLVGWDAVNLGKASVTPIAAGIMASCCYGIATNYTKTAPSIPAFENAHGSMWAAVVIVLPLLPFMPMRAMPSGTEFASVVALGIICTGAAYLLYFRLVAEIGPASALSVTFLIPMFGILWGALILDEPIGWNTLLGTTMVLVGTSFVTGFSLRQIFRSPTHTSSTE